MRVISGWSKVRSSLQSRAALPPLPYVTALARLGGDGRKHAAVITSRSIALLPPSHAQTSGGEERAEVLVPEESDDAAGLGDGGLEVGAGLAGPWKSAAIRRWRRNSLLALGDAWKKRAVNARPQRCRERTTGPRPAR
jgi:hypothetical protein